MEDSKIIKLYWQRNEAAIAETKNKYGAYCFTVASSILLNREDSEECVSDTWMFAWNSIPPHRPNRLKMFLAKITRNLSFNKYSKKTAEKRGGGEIDAVLHELEECIAGSGDVESAYIAEELEQSIRKFVRGLPERECNLFVRRYFFTESISDIAKRYNLTKNNTSVILSRTRQKLKKHLEQEGYFG